MSSTKIVAFNTLFQLLAKTVTTGTTLIITRLITTSFGEGGFGNFNTILSYIYLFYLFADFGLNPILTKKFVSEETKSENYFGNLIGVRLALSVLTSLFALSILAFSGHSPEVKLGIIIASGMIFTQGLFTSATAVFQAKMRYDRVAAADILGALVTLFLAYLVIQGNGGAVFIILAYVLGGFTRIGVSFFLLREFIEKIRLNFNLTIWKSLLWMALPLGITNIFSQINANVDKQIIYLANYRPELGLTGETAAGIYGLAYRIFDVILVFPLFIINSVYPILIRKNSESSEDFKEAVKKVGFFLIAVSLVGAVGGILLAPFVLNIFRDDQSGFAGSDLVLQILLSGLPLFFLSALTMWVLITLGKQKVLVFVYGFAALFNFTTNVIFVPKFGYLAAAVITLITEMIILTMTAYLVVRYFKKERPTK
jgi:O-antigen/teichoic acid export membrane protein